VFKFPHLDVDATVKSLHRLLLTASYAGETTDGQYTMSSSTTRRFTSASQLVTFKLLSPVLWSFTRYLFTYYPCLNYSTTSVLMTALHMNLDSPGGFGPIQSCPFVPPGPGVSPYPSPRLPIPPFRRRRAVRSRLELILVSGSFI